jgi:hypothetical protein
MTYDEACQKANAAALRNDSRQLVVLEYSDTPDGDYNFGTEFDLETYFLGCRVLAVFDYSDDDDQDDFDPDYPNETGEF